MYLTRKMYWNMQIILKTQQWDISPCPHPMNLFLVSWINLCSGSCLVQKLTTVQRVESRNLWSAQLQIKHLYTLSPPYKARGGSQNRDRETVRIRGQRGPEPNNSIFWIWQDPCTHDLKAPALSGKTCTRSIQPMLPWRWEGLMSPQNIIEELWTVEDVRGRKLVFLKGVALGKLTVF